MGKRGTKSAPKLSQLAGASERDSLASWAMRYLEWLRVKNYAAWTVSHREAYLVLLIGWCEERSVTYPQEVTKPILERYQRHLFHLRKADGKALTFRAQRARLVPVRAYFKWLTKQNVLLYNPASELELPRLEHRLPRHVLSISEVERVLHRPNLGDALGLRDRAILEVLYATGMRRGELIGLGVFDVDLERGTVLIRQGKGKKDRVVPLGERAGAWVEKYLYEIRPELVVADEGTLFVTNVGESFMPSRLTQLVRGYVKDAALGKSGSCHLFRHTAATLMLEGGADIRYIQALLGHAELSTTQIYTQVSIRKLQEVHRATHPGARLVSAATEASREDEASGAEAREALFSLLDAESEEESGE